MPEADRRLRSRVEERLSAECPAVEPVFRYSTMSGSKQGDCLRIDMGQQAPRSFVLKRFHEAADHDHVRVATAEYDALWKFSDALRGSPVAVRCPAPVALFTDEAAYVMDFVRGEALERVLPTRSVDSGVEDEITDGLEVYYRSVDRAYRDFHPGNVLVGSAPVVLLDPTLPDSFFDELHTGSDLFGADDLGYWLYSEGAKSVKRRLVRGDDSERRLDFIRRLASAMAGRFAPGREAEYRLAVLAVARRHLERLRTSRGLLGTAFHLAGTRFFDRAETLMEVGA